MRGEQWERPGREFRVEFEADSACNDEGAGLAVSVIGVLVLLFLVVGALSGGRKKRGRGSKRRAPAKVAARPAVALRAPAVSVSVTPPARPPAGRKSDYVWHPLGSAPVVRGHRIEGGMVYVGRTEGGQFDGTGYIIDPSLDAAPDAPGQPAQGMGYWPAYRAIPSSWRLKYLQWLAGGKLDPAADVGLVFLYFYGLERRLLVDRPAAGEQALLLAEVRRLRTIYASNRSFDGYSRGLLDAGELMRLAADPKADQAFKPDLAVPAGTMPFGLKVAIARRVVSEQPLDFELAAAGLIGVAREHASRSVFVVDRQRTFFLTLLRSRFAEAFPAGFKLRNRKDSRLHFDYHPAGAGLRVDLSGLIPAGSLPDPATLTWTKLVELGISVAEQLQPHTLLLANHPERANTLGALVGLPQELAAGLVPEARAWAAALPKPVAAVRFEELARRAIGLTGVKWTARHHKAVADALSCVGCGLEPDPRDGSTALEDSTMLFVFKEAAGSRSPSYSVAAAACGLVAALARASDGRADTVGATWLEQVKTRLRLSPDELVRLEARLLSLRNASVGLAKAKRLLAEASAADREVVAWSAACAAAAGGLVERDQVALLEGIYEKLGVPKAGLYSVLHGAAASAAVAADAPVTVARESASPAYGIPRPPEPKRPGLDEDRIRAIFDETHKVSAVLADIFVEDDAPPSPPEPADAGGAFAGLDAAHGALVAQLLTRPTWPRVEFDALATASGLMPDGCLDKINEWAFDRFGEALLEEGPELVVVPGVVERVTEAAEGG
jgi:hypothetical protein